jgi:hypothetical protein
MTERVEEMRAELLQIVRELSTTGTQSMGLAVSMHEREAGERAIAEFDSPQSGGRCEGEATAAQAREAGRQRRRIQGNRSRGLADSFE